MVDDEVCGEGNVTEEGSEGFGVVEFIVGGVPFGVGCAGVSDVGVLEMGWSVRI